MNPEGEGLTPSWATNNKYNIMEIRFKRLSDKAIMPIRAHVGDAGVDLTATKITTELNEVNQLLICYHTDLAVEIPEGYVGLLFPRSSIYTKSLQFTNSVGVIDSGYRGELMVKMRSTTDVVPGIYKEGERFAQLVIVPVSSDYTITEAAELTETDRSTDGFGSTGNETSAVGESNMQSKQTADQVDTEQAADDLNTSETAA